MEKTKISELLGIYGYGDLDYVILAVLATQSPVLLVGAHGSAKSMLVEKLSSALGLQYRFYNASLLNYDDLVGIPVPSADYSNLNYISDSASIWDAETVFIDEINRTKPELQNKLFPIIYDKRVQGRNLDKLQFRFAAMNPPCSDDNGETPDYEGIYELDIALADRFPFICEVPTWENLDKNERMKMLLREGKNPEDKVKGVLKRLTEKAKKELNALDDEFDRKTAMYSICLTDVLGQYYGYVSARRAVMFKDTFKALFAAMKAVGEAPTFEDCALVHIKYVLPLTAQKGRTDKMKLVAICREVLNSFESGDNFNSIKDPTKRLTAVLKAKKQMENSMLCDYISSCLGFLDKKQRKAACLVTFLVLKNCGEVYASLIETIGSEIKPLLQPQHRTNFVSLRERKIGDRVTYCVSQQVQDKPYYVYHKNLLNYYLITDIYKSADEVDMLSKYFLTLWEDVFASDSGKTEESA